MRTAVANPIEEQRARAARLEGYLAQDPTNLSLLAEVVDVHLQSQSPQQAEPWAKCALELQPDSGPARYRLAVVYHRLNKLAEARQLLDDLAAAHPGEWGVQLERARVAFAQADHAAVSQMLGQAAEHGVPPEWAAEVALLHARSLHYTGQVAEAIALVEQRYPVAAEVPPVLCSALATLYIDAERLADAAKLFHQAQQRGAMGAEMLSAGGYLALASGQQEEAQQSFNQSLAAAPHMGRSHLGRGLALAVAGQLPQATQAVAAATQAMPTHLGSWHALAWLHLLANNVGAAEAAFQSAMAVDDRFGDTHGGLAMVAALRGQREAAEAHLRVAQRLDRLSLNAGVARTLLKHGAGLDQPHVLRDALQMFNEQALATDSTKRSLFERLLAQAAKPGTGSNSRH